MRKSCFASLIVFFSLSLSLGAPHIEIKGLRQWQRFYIGQDAPMSVVIHNIAMPEEGKVEITVDWVQLKVPDTLGPQFSLPLSTQLFPRPGAYEVCIWLRPKNDVTELLDKACRVLDFCNLHESALEETATVVTQRYLDTQEAVGGAESALHSINTALSHVDSLTSISNILSGVPKLVTTPQEATDYPLHHDYLSRPFVIFNSDNWEHYPDVLHSTTVSAVPASSQPSRIRPLPAHALQRSVDRIGRLWATTARRLAYLQTLLHHVTTAVDATSAPVEERLQYIREVLSAPEPGRSPPPTASPADPLARLQPPSDWPPPCPGGDGVEMHWKEGACMQYHPFRAPGEYAQRPGLVTSWPAHDAYYLPTHMPMIEKQVRLHEADCLMMIKLKKLKYVDVVVSGCVPAPRTVKYAHQITMFICHEGDRFAGVRLDPSRYSTYDVHATFDLTAELPLTYMPSNLSLIMHPPQKKTGFIALMVTNCGDSTPERNDLMYKFMHMLPVDSFGHCFHNKDLPEPCPELFGSKQIGLQAQYKFVLSFENYNQIDYTSERFFDTFIAGSVPVYWGAPNAAELAPAPHSFIHVDDYDLLSLSQYLNYLNENDTAYEEYLSWKHTGVTERFKELSAMSWADPGDRYCRAHNDHSGFSPLRVCTKLKEFLAEKRSKPPAPPVIDVFMPLFTKGGVVGECDGQPRCIFTVEIIVDEYPKDAHTFIRMGHYSHDDPNGHIVLSLAGLSGPVQMELEIFIVDAGPIGSHSLADVGALDAHTGLPHPSLVVARRLVELDFVMPQH